MSLTSLCPACGQSSVSNLDAWRVDGHTIEWCPTCGLGTLSDPPIGEDLAELYATDLYAPGMPRAWPVLRAVHRRLNRHLLRALGAPAGRLLDVGAGKGHLLAAALEAGWDAEGIEYSSASAAKAADLYGVDVRVADFMNVPVDREPYDAIAMIHVLEHLPDPARALERARSLLGPGGQILISVPNVTSYQARLFRDRWLHLDLPRHLYQFTPEALVRLLERSGFDVTHLDTFAPDMEVTGLVQSTLNAAGFERNVALRFVKRDAAAERGARTLGAMVVAAAILPGAFGWSVLAPVLGGGASLQVVGRSR